MNYQQYLLVKLAEEASEVAQMAIKCSLFGYDSVDPREDTGETNALKLYKEMLDFSAVIDELDELDGVIDIDFNPDDYIDMKRLKLQYYYDVHTLSELKKHNKLTK